MSDYPTPVFTNSAHKHNRPNQRIFTDYGCWESVNVEFVENEPVVFARKHRPLHVGESTDFGMSGAGMAADSRVLSPEHDFLTLGEPGEIDNLIEDDIKLEDLCVVKVEKTGKKASHFFAAPVQDYINNLAHDHPDVMYQTFMQLMNSFRDVASDDSSESEEYESILKTSQHFLGNKKAVRYLKHIDPTMCDVGAKMLRESLVEEMQKQALHHFADRDYSGGCLKYTCLGKSGMQQYGFLACPQGQAMDDLSIKLLCIQTPAQLDPEDMTSSSFHTQRRPPYVPSLHLGSEYRQSLNGRILQIETVPHDGPGDHLIGVRSDYHVLLNLFRSDDTSWEIGSNSAKYTSEDMVSTVGLLKTSSGSEVTSIALSPYIAGDCAIASSDRCVRLWNADIGTSPQVESLDVLMTGTMGGLRSSNTWRQVRYAGHPRQLYVADTGNVCLFDMRTENDSISVLNIGSSKHAADGEEIHCIESCHRLGNEYQCLVATDFSLYLMDQRHCGEPLLQSGTYMTTPPQYICPCPVTTWKPESEFSSHNWTYDTMSVFLGNQYAKEVYSYQFCNTSKSADSKHVRGRLNYPPQSMGPPRILGSFGDVWSYLRSRPLQHHSYVQSRTAKMTIGLDAVPLDDFKGEKERGAILLMQINAVGDIGYQTLSMRPTNEAYDLANLVTGKTSATFLSEEEEKNMKNINDLKMKNYDHWTEVICSPLNESSESDSESEDEGESGIAGLHITPHSEHRLKKSLRSYILQCGDAVDSCMCCNMPYDSSATEHNNESVSCDSCGLETGSSEAMYQILKRPDKALNAETCCDTDLSEDLSKESRETVSKLVLINLQQIDKLGNELAKLMNGTWDGTYEDYWREKRREEENKKEEERVEQNQSTLDLSSRIPSPMVAIESPQESLRDKSVENTAGVRSILKHNTENASPSLQRFKNEASNASTTAFSFWRSSSQSRRKSLLTTSNTAEKNAVVGNELVLHSTVLSKGEQSGGSGALLFSLGNYSTQKAIAPPSSRTGASVTEISPSPRKRRKKDRRREKTFSPRDSKHRRISSPALFPHQSGESDDELSSGLGPKTLIGDLSDATSSPAKALSNRSPTNLLPPNAVRTSEIDNGRLHRPSPQKMPPLASFTSYSPQASKTTRMNIQSGENVLDTDESGSLHSQSPQKMPHPASFSFFSPRKSKTMQMNESGENVLRTDESGSLRSPSSRKMPPPTSFTFFSPHGSNTTQKNALSGENVPETDKSGSLHSQSPQKMPPTTSFSFFSPRRSETRQRDSSADFPSPRTLTPQKRFSFFSPRKGSPKIPPSPTVYGRNEFWDENRNKFPTKHDSLPNSPSRKRKSEQNLLERMGF